MLVLAPATCCLGGVAADQILATFCSSIHPEEGSGGWSGLFKTLLDGQEAAPSEASPPQKPTSSTTSLAVTGKRQKGASKVGLWFLTPKAACALARDKAACLVGQETRLNGKIWQGQLRSLR